ncbi:PP2C family protein-serine/threonine phosphatase [Microcoleus sp. OTE_8_concoct_300]|uniref:PP2C family protein-serine/threonine phosphatase n=1 Tax=Microcoleus sp. OTE_8_concoct_300 TaxID=2964710 RepID=UPI00403F18A3
MNRKSLGIHLINLLSYPQKFTLIGFLFAIPLTFVMYLLICEINSLVYLRKKKNYGNQYLHTLRQLREYIPKLQLVNYQSLNPNLSNSESRANLEAKIDANFQSLANTDSQLGNILMCSKDLNKFNQNLPNLKLRRSQWSLETYDFVYQRLTADLNRLSVPVGDTSHLIFDPDLEIYYLINATLLNLPEMQKILSEIRLISQKISLRSDATPEERAQLITLSSRLIEIADLAINMEVAFSHNHQGNRRPKLTLNLKFLKSLVKQLAQRIYQSVLIKHDASINGRSFALNSSFKLWDKTVNELYFSLQYRISFFVKTPELIFILFLITLAIFIDIFLCYYSAVRQTVFVFDEASKKMASGNLAHKIIWDNREPEGQVVGAFNKITDALIGKNQEIPVINDRLKAENRRMISELDLTTKIQQILLPKYQEFKEVIGLNIAEFMESAEEVCGDYYDVLPHKGRVKIGMDDVTGHGWESGVLMIMVQTAFRTGIADNEPDLVKNLSAINSVIYDNVQRLKFDKNASLALLDYQQGMLKLSGQHGEIIVVRCNGCVEWLDTIDLGFPIGLDAEIAEFVAQTSVQLYSGDVVVLYTDGITEAENMDKLLYGLDRLIEVIEINWQRSAAEIRHAVIKDVRSHIGKQKVFDDITLLVFKQK